MKDMPAQPPVVIYVQNPSSAQSNADVRVVSSGEYSGDPSSRPVDLLARLKHETPARWMRFCHHNFHGPTHTAIFFGVDEKTGRNWWEGVGRPTADKMVVAQMTFPTSFQTYMLAA